MCKSSVLEKKDNLIYKARFNCLPTSLSVHNLMDELRDFIGEYSSGSALDEQLLILGESLANIVEYTSCDKNECDIQINISIFADRHVFQLTAPTDYMRSGSDLYRLFSKLYAEYPERRKYKTILDFLSRRYRVSCGECSTFDFMENMDSLGIDSILDSILSERGRGLFLIKHFTGGNMDFDYDGQFLTETLTYHV